MQTKTLKLLELNDDEVKINSMIVKFVAEHPINFFIDYRDFDYIEELIGKCKTLDDFKDYIWESYSEAIYDETRYITDEIEHKLLEEFSGYDELSDPLREHIYEYVQDYVEVNLPIDEFLNHKIRVNLLVTYNKSQQVFEEDLDYKTLSAFLTKLGYTKPMSIITNLKSNKYDGDDEFLKSLRIEILNSYSGQLNYLTFIGEMKVKDYYKILSDPYAKVLIPKDVTAGFVDPCNGGGSTLALALPKNISITPKVIKKIMVEGVDKYSVEDIYGLTRDCYKTLRVE